MALNLPWAVGLAAMLAYAAAAWPVPSRSRWPEAALALGWLAHAAFLLLDISGLLEPQPGARFGFAPALSLTVWLVIAVHAVESRLLPLPAVRRLLAVSATLVVLLTVLFPGEMRPHAGSAWLPLHWLLGIASYGLFAVAVLHASLLDSAESRMRLRAPGDHGVLGMPLLRLERLTFRFVEAGFIVLTLTLLLGMVTAGRWRWDHKSVFSLLSWVVFAALLAGRITRGWRGRHATRWLYAGTVLLLLGYVGSRFVFEVVLQRTAG